MVTEKEREGDITYVEIQQRMKSICCCITAFCWHFILAANAEMSGMHQGHSFMVFPEGMPALCSRSVAYIGHRS